MQNKFELKTPNAVIATNDVNILLAVLNQFKNEGENYSSLGQSGEKISFKLARRNHSQIFWTEEEDQFLLENMDKTPNEVKKLIGTSRHTSNAIGTRLSAMKAARNSKRGGDRRISSNLFKKIKEKYDQ